ncbi:hypothetical protein F3Y22_tig00110387pilonHSYRG00429 [Hibiscus syriacus]|uniref:Uncharacterized protein n=1 Tax=Hibiscus syriacus TaxID=106335 RepID=A0A6A3AU87_HIBSY|nr:hypothetical protein F3Y22_tig00110387pilonHSYRG00429 [Hibiscus syriacus]
MSTLRICSDDGSNYRWEAISPVSPSKLDDDSKGTPIAPYPSMADLLLEGSSKQIENDDRGVDKYPMNITEFGNSMALKESSIAKAISILNEDDVASTVTPSGGSLFVSTEALKRARSLLGEQEVTPSTFLCSVSGNIKNYKNSDQPQPTEEEETDEFLGVTQQLIDYVKSFTLDTFKNFAIQDNGSIETQTSYNVRMDLSDWQQRHAVLVHSKVKARLSILENHGEPTHIILGETCLVVWSILTLHKQGHFDSLQLGCKGSRESSSVSRESSSISRESSSGSRESSSGSRERSSGSIERSNISAEM